jgi:hypothetical protein
MHLMILAFLIDQIQQRCCSLFQAAVSAALGKSRFWRLLRSTFVPLPNPGRGDNLPVDHSSNRHPSGTRHVLISGCERSCPK